MYKVDIHDKEQELFEMAKSWLTACSQTHDECNKDIHGALPTRLISIVGDEVKLVLTEGWKSPARFSTLSHRWGSDAFLKLTTENYHSFLTKIPIEALPQTFKDAVEITRGLGLDYLWIDSLCIVQGSLEDWRREAALMSSVYGGSWINIAASSATSVHEGCFLNTAHSINGLRARIKVKGSKFVREFRSNSIYDASVTNSHLATRAWALQEKILSPRTIHFGEYGAFWECRTRTANQFLPDGFSTKLGRGVLESKSREDLQSWWEQIVRMYSATDVTFDSDRLPAISGIARSVNKESGLKYLAGLWLENIEAQLCWQALDAHKRPLWRAPSWTWASINGRVAYRVTQPGVLDDVYIHVLDSEVEHVGADPFGEVKSGTLRISCKGLLACRFTGKKTVKLQLDKQYMDDINDLFVTLDCLDEGLDSSGSIFYLLPVLGGETGAAMRAPGTAVNVHKDEINKEKEEDAPSDDGEVGREIEEEEHWRPEFLLVCVLLIKTDEIPGQFRRVGLCECWKQRLSVSHKEVVGVDENQYDPILRHFEHHGGAVAQGVCAEVMKDPQHPNERYVITII